MTTTYAAGPVMATPTAIVPGVPTTTLQPESNIHFGNSPVTMICPNCNREITTRVRYKAGPLLIVIVIVLFFILTIFSLLFLCCDAFKRPVHYCPHCGTKLGKGHECS